MLRYTHASLPLPAQATNHDYNKQFNAYDKLLSITAMDAYAGRSFEELRWEDYQRRAAGGGAFGAAAPAPGLFVSGRMGSSGQCTC